MARPKKTNRDDGEAAAVTNKLRQIQRGLQERLGEGAQALQSLNEDAEALKDVNETLDDLDQGLKEGNKLLGRFDRKIFFDYLWIYSAFLMYLCTLAYVFYRRSGLEWIMSLTWGTNQLEL
eukprot:m.139016 g.139016  ORF g.139016 m.139016 type:complete len:121 (+) comp14788_c0_seq4:206-568(+)